MAGHSPDDEPHEESWTDALPICQHSGIGTHQNQSYRGDGSRMSYRESEDFFFHFRTDDAQTYLYAIFDGYDGKKVASFAHQRLPAELLLGQLEERTNDGEVKATLRQAILTVERSYFESIDNLLAERAVLMMSLPQEYYNDSQSSQAMQFQEEISKLRALDENLKGGSALMVALLHHEKLYVANVGDSRALLCTKTDDGSLDVIQVSVDHSLRNDDEVLRLEQLGIGTNTFQSEPLVGDSFATRTIGNYSVKGGYRENPELRVASKEPVIADPDIIGGLSTKDKIGFLLMYTHGFWQALEAATGTTQVDKDIAAMVQREFSQQKTLSSVAQAVVDRVVRMHHDAFMNGEREKDTKKREDITLIVRNLNFPLGIHIYIPPRDSDVHKDYPVTTPIYDPSHEMNEGDLPTPVPLDHTPTPIAPGTGSSGGLNTNSSSESSDQRLRSSSSTGEPEEEPLIDAYVDFKEFNLAMLNYQMEDLCIP